jgi:16S rRNA A1518/A1519 N6-dimethyltransferase RsmA/KsgA/DIM1 with predicted DNA glycosylase/AP lyase activity
VKQCFKQPRRTLKNNLQQTHYATDRVSEELLASRAQQLNIDDLLALWDALHT